MWCARSVKIGIWLILCFVEVASDTCGERCVRCEAGGCRKCRRLIVEGSRACVDACPAGTREEWSPLVDYMGRVCRAGTFLGLPRRALAALAGAGGGAAVCVTAALCAAILLRRRGSSFRALLHLRPRPRPRSRAASSAGLGGSGARQAHAPAVGNPDKQLFLKYLSLLRCEAPVFLAMLNDTRRHLRELHNRENYNDSALQVYRPVLRDLARILILLNRPENQVMNLPADWSALLIWGEKILRTYKMQNPHQVSQVQLPSFLQIPFQNNSPSSTLYLEPDIRRRELTTFQPFHPTGTSTFKSNYLNSNNPHSIPLGQTKELQELLISSFDSDFEPEGEDSFNGAGDCVVRRGAALLQPSLLDSSDDFNARWEAAPASYTALSDWSPGDLGPADGFLCLGLRPQDEITTEL